MCVDFPTCVGQQKRGYLTLPSLPCGGLAHLGPSLCSCSPVRCSQIYPVASSASSILMIKCVLLSMAHMTFCILASSLVCLEVRDGGLSVLKLGWFWGKPDGWSPSVFLSSSLICCSPLWLQGISVSGLCSPVFTPYL